MEDTKIRVVDLEFEDDLKVEDVAKELQVETRVARVLLSQGIIKSNRINGYYTKRSLVEKYKQQLARAH